MSDLTDFLMDVGDAFSALSWQQALIGLALAYVTLYVLVYLIVGRHAR